METKINTSFQYRKSYTQSRRASVRSNAYADSAGTRGVNADTFTRSYFDSFGEIGNNPINSYAEHREEFERFRDGLKNAVRLEPLNIAKDDYAGRTKFNFEWIDFFEKNLNEGISKSLEEAGVPKDVTFEFDFNFDSSNIEITGISDEKYRESVENVLAGSKGTIPFISCASRVMNGYISSLYYPWISKHLERCFEQDINDLYIDENGNLGGVNENLQAAFAAEKKAEKSGEYFSVLQEFDFPANNIEGIVKRLISDKNITPNISHMGYDGERIYTNDGEFKFGKDFAPNLFSEEKYVMRGTMAFYMTFYDGRHNRWLENEEKFY